MVFNTAITGYQEILTDPSYFQQIVTLTYPHIGNVGANADDEESPRVYASGLIIRDVPKRQSNWRSEGPLGDYLNARGSSPSPASIPAAWCASCGRMGRNGAL